MHIRYIYDILYIIPHNHFTFFLINIVTLYTFFNEFMQHFTHFSRQFYAEYRIKARYAHDMLLDIGCTKSHLVPPASCT